MENKESQWTNENMTTFLYALQGELNERGIPSKVEFFSHPENGNSKYKNIVGVSIRTNQGQVLYEIWQTQKGDIYWNDYEQNPLQGFNFRV